jgi:hypothetical protein
MVSATIILEHIIPFYQSILTYLHQVINNVHKLPEVALCLVTACIYTI